MRTTEPIKSQDGNYWFRVPAHIQNPMKFSVEHLYTENVEFVDGVGKTSNRNSADSLYAMQYQTIINPAEVPAPVSSPREPEREPLPPSSTPATIPQREAVTEKPDSAFDLAMKRVRDRTSLTGKSGKTHTRH